MNLSEPFIKRPVMTTLVMVAILLFGIFAYKALPVSDLPNIDYPTITVTAQQPGGSPEYMANTVASPLERNFATISGLANMTSNNIMGQSQIVLNFDLDVNLDGKEVEVQAAITQTLPDLPPMPNNPTFKKTNPADTPILFMVLTSDTLTLGTLYQYGYDVLAQPISMINGISQVQVYGYPYAVRVQADPMKLVAHSVDFNELAKTLVDANPNLPAGTLQGPLKNVQVESFGQLMTGEAYNNVIIKDVDGFPLRVSNIGDAKSALYQRDPYFHYINDETDQSTVVLAISRLPGSNTLQISDQIKRELPALERTLPASVNLEIFYDQAQTITASVFDVELTLLIALVLVVLVIFVYLGKFFETIIPSIVLPMSILATFVVIYLLGFNLDILSLLALTLAIGFIVDDSIVVLENIVRHTEMGKGAMEASLDGSRQISVTVFSMTIALSAVFIPMIWMPGILGRIFHEFAVTIVVAILCSGFISLTLNPMLCSRFLRKQKSEDRGGKKNFSARMNAKFVEWYEWALHHSIHFKKTTLLVGLLCLGFSFVFLRILPTDFLPTGNISLLQGLTQVEQGSSILNTTRFQKQVNEILRESPYQEGFVTIAGYPTSDQGIVFIRLIDPEKRPSSSAISWDLMHKLFMLPGVNTYLKPIPLINLQVGNSSSLGNYQYTLRGNDTKTLYHYAGILTQKMQQMPELVGVNSDMRVKSPQLNFNIDRDRASTYGLTAKQIESTLQFAYAGGRISTFNMGTNLYNLVVEAQPGFDLTEADVDLLYVKAPKTGEMVPMQSVATWEQVAAPSAINHIDIFPSVTISFNLANRAALGSVLEKLDALAAETIPDSIIAEVQGQGKVFRETFKNMRFLIIIAIMVIYIVLGILYESFIHPFTILSALPVATFGGMLTLWIFGEPLSLYSVVGMIVLIGLVQKNGIMMIDFALEFMEKGDSPLQAILDACKERFRPIIMTTLAAMMGALPIAIGIGENGETNRPLGLVVVGGLIFSQLLTLFVTPVVFLYMQQFQEFVRRKKKA